MNPYQQSAGVLVVEDEPLVAQYIEHLLTELGFNNIRLARDIDSGLRLTLSATPAFAILDVNIGGEVVFPLAAALRERGATILFSTGSRHREFPPEWASTPVVLKPIDANILSRALSAIGISPGREPPVRARIDVQRPPGGGA